MAFRNVYMPARVGPMHAVVQEELFVHACIRVHHGKTKVWNQAGVRPAACNALERIAQTNNPASRHRCRPVGVSDKGTRGFAQQNTVHQRCPEHMVVACPLRFGTCVLPPQGPQTVSGGGIRTGSRRWFVSMLAEHPSVGPAPVFC